MGKENKTKQIHFRITEEDYDFFLQKMKESNQSNMSKYFRMLLSNSVPKYKKNNSIISSKSSKTQDEIINKLINSINKIGLNINQITKEILSSGRKQRKDGTPVINTPYVAAKQHAILKYLNDIKTFISIAIVKIEDIKSTSESYVERTGPRIQ